MSTQDFGASAARTRRSTRMEEHQVMEHSRTVRRPRTLRLLGMWVASAALIVTQLAVPAAQAAPITTAAAQAAAPAAQTSTIKLAVTSARTELRALGGSSRTTLPADPAVPTGVKVGDPITTYKWIINEDNTGQNTTRNANPGGDCSAWLDAAHAQPNPAYPDSCKWTSIAGLASSAPVAAQGDETTLNTSTGISGLAPGRYLISVLADGFKLDGTPFTVPMEAPGVVEVPLQPSPLPTATIKAQVFADVTSANGQFDPGEDGLPGFAGYITDYIGQVTTDVFGNPLCTLYDFNDANHNGIQDPGEEVILSAPDYTPTVKHLGGRCLSGDINLDGVVDATDVSLYGDPQLDPGVLTIPNLGPNRYALSVVPPTGSSWVQTTTLEGNHDWDSWVMEGSTGLDTEFVVAGEPFPAQIFGFVPAPSSSYTSSLGTRYWQHPYSTSHPYGDSFAAGGTGTITGVVDAMKVYVPTTGGACLPGTIWGGLCGGKIDKPIDKPWITLSDLNNGDTAVWMGRGDSTGKFTIPNVPAGSYTITYWDDAQNYILDLLNVTVANGETVDMGVLPLTGWFTKFDGYVFNDDNRNGKRDPGEKGVPNFTLTLRKRENSLMDRGATLVTTNSQGYYLMENAYPLTEWLVLEAYDDRYYTTGVTYQADNQPTPTTVLGQGVDVSVLPIIGLSGTLDWGVHFYDPTGANGVDPQNGGIVGSVSYDTTRNELNPQYAVAEDWQPGVSGLTVDLYAPVPCPTDGSVPCDATGDYVLASDGSYAHGKLLNTYVTETWQRPTDCIARGVDGKPLQNPADQQVMPIGAGKGCLEGPLAGVQFGPYPTDQGTSDANFGAAVDGNYGFGDACFSGTLVATDPSAPHCAVAGGTITTEDSGGTVLTDSAATFQSSGVTAGMPVTNTSDRSTGIVQSVDSETQITLAARLTGGTSNAFTVGDEYAVGDVPFEALPGDDYLVHVDLPSIKDKNGKTVYKVTREEDINIASGDSYVPQVPPPACAGAFHTVDVATSGTDSYPPATITDPSGIGSAQITVPASTPIDNPTFADPGMGGSPYEGQAKPLCDTKLVTLQNGKSVVPGFNVFTDVPLPTRFFAYNVDDLNFSTDPKSLLYGEKAGLPFTPVGIYDFADRLVTTSETDYNGLFDVLLPSTDRISCPTPSGVCGNVYRFVGNDPGVPGRLNPNYNPQYRTIAADFEAWPGIIVPADTAPTQVGVTIQLPGTTTFQPVSCPVDAAAPQLFAVSRPYVDATTRTFTITGTGFGASRGSGAVTLDGLTVPVTSWGNTAIAVNIPAAAPVGPHQLKVTAANGMGTVNGLTVHVLGTGYNPALYEVGPTGNPNYTAAKASAGRWFTPAETLPAAADHAIQRALDAAPPGALVVVYPNNSSANPRQNPRGAYYENLIISKQVKLQGVGPGSSDGAARGTIIDGGAFAGDSPVAADWYTRIGTLTWDGNQTVYDGAVISLFLPSSGTNAFPATFSPTTAPSIDGLDLRGGDQQGFPGNINIIGGGPTGAPAGLVTQGGAIFANAYARNLQITNNVVQNNGGAFGTIRIGTPDLPAPDTSNHNEGVRLANNRIIANAGTNLAGGIGLFAGSDGYAVTGNDICGNFSAEYGGGLSVYGLSPNGSIDHNRIYYNQSYDEAGGIMIAGQLPADPSILSPGSGPVDIHDNVIQANLANDDGGGIRFLMAGNFPMNVYNNMIVNNVSTHEGGGIAIDDAPNVRVYNNTIMKNVTTATAVTSNGQPAPAGLSSGQNSALLQATLPAGSSTFSDPLLFNDIFWDNRAGTRAGSGVTGIGATGDPNPVNNWDLGVADLTGQLSPTNSVLQTSTGITASPTNSSLDPAVVSPYSTALTFAPWRTNPNFIGAILIAADLPANLMGNYHLQNNSSPAYNTAAASKASIAAPASDIDGDGRPAFGSFDIGADEIPATTANLSITKTDAKTTVTQGSTDTYTLVVANTGPNPAIGASVVDNVPAALTGASWTCSATAGSSCSSPSGTGNLGTTVNLAVGGSATILLTATVAPSATGTLVNTATVTPAPGTLDPNPANNSATDSDTILPTADLSITKTDGQTTVVVGGVLQYSVVVSNAGPRPVTSATVNDSIPANLTGVTWTCTASAGSSCGTASGTANITNRTVSLLGGGTATFTVNGTASATGSLANTARVTAPTGITDPNMANNTATDTDSVTSPAIALPALGLLDNFNRANAATLGANWSQTTAANSVIRVNTNQANCALVGNCTNGTAIWNGATNVFGPKQGAAITLATAPGASALLLKASGGSASAPASFIRVRYALAGGSVIVETTANGGGSYTQRGTLAATFAAGNTLTAVANADGSVDVWQNSTYVGRVTGTTLTAGGRIGMQLVVTSRADDFRGATVP